MGKEEIETEETLQKERKKQKLSKLVSKRYSRT